MFASTKIALPAVPDGPGFVGNICSYHVTPPSRVCSARPSLSRSSQPSSAVRKTIRKKFEPPVSNCCCHVAPPSIVCETLLKHEPLHVVRTPQPSIGEMKSMSLNDSSLMDAHVAPPSLVRSSFDAASQPCEASMKSTAPEPRTTGNALSFQVAPPSPVHLEALSPPNNTPLARS